MTADEADDMISELGTAEVARSYGFGPQPYGPPSKWQAQMDGADFERRRKIVEASNGLMDRVYARIERDFARS